MRKWPLSATVAWYLLAALGKGFFRVINCIIHRNCKKKVMKLIRAGADGLLQLSIDHNTDVQSVCSWAPKVARKCESKHWYACGAEGRSGG